MERLNKRILIVIGNESIREILSCYMNEAKLNYFNIVVGSDAALAHCKAQNYDIVVIDNSLSGTKGIALIPQILKLQPTVKTILMTGGSVSREEATAAGAHAIVRKPLEEGGKVLTETVTRLLESKEG